MPNLYDVIELSAPKKTKVEESYKNVLTEANSAYQFLKGIGAQSSQQEMVKKVDEKLQQIRKDAFADALSLPPALQNMAKVTVSSTAGLHAQVEGYGRPDALGRLSSRAQSTLSRLRNTADILGMVVMPYGALDERSLKSESYTVCQAVNLFVKDGEEAGLDLYVIAPLSLYSVERHVAMSDGADQLYSKTHDATLTTISLQLPLFRSVFQALNGLDTRVSALETAQQQMKVQISALSERLVELEKKADQARKAAYQAQLAAEAANAAAASAAVQALSQHLMANWFPSDPLVFAVPKGTKILDEAPAIVGPAWGPDFPDILLDVCGLKVVKGQRKKLSAI